MQHDDIADLLRQLLGQILNLGLLLKMVQTLVEENGLLAQLLGQLSL